MSKELTFLEALRAAKGMGEHILKVDYIIDNYLETEETIFRWLDGHPMKTRKQDFLEKYPNARMLDGKPTFCCRNIGYVISDKDCCRQDCYECWNTPIDEDEKK